MNKIVLILALLAGVSIEHTLAREQLGQVICGDEKSCKDMNTKRCQCYCSAKGDYRAKNSSDNPVFVPGDEYFKNGKAVHCFCKQWDLEKFPGPAKRN